MSDNEPGTGEQAWTFFGHWSNDRIIVEYWLPGEVEDPRVDSGYWPEGPWAAAGTGATIDEARRNAVAEYETDHASG